MTAQGRRTLLRAVLIASLVVALAYLERPRLPAGPPLQWREDLEAALGEASSERRPALVSFHAVWCSVCRKLDHQTLRAPAVAAELERFIRVRVDASGTDWVTSQLLGRFRVSGLPTLLILDGSGEQKRILGYVPPDRLLPLLRTQ